MLFKLRVWLAGSLLLAFASLCPADSRWRDGTEGRRDRETDHPMAIMIIMIVRNCLLASFSYDAAAAVAPNEDWPCMASYGLDPGAEASEDKLYQRMLVSVVIINHG